MTIWDLINRVDDPADLILYDSWGNQIEDPEILNKCVDTFVQQLVDDFPYLKHKDSFQKIHFQARKLFKILEKRGIIISPDALITIELADATKGIGRHDTPSHYLRRISLSQNEISFSNLEDLKTIVEQPIISSLINCPLPRQITRTAEYKAIEKLKHQFNQEDMWWPTDHSAPEGYALSNEWIPQIDIQFIQREEGNPIHGSAQAYIHEIGSSGSDGLFSPAWKWKSDPYKARPEYVGLDGQRLPTSWTNASLILLMDLEVDKSMETLKMLCREVSDIDYYQEAMRLLASHARFGEVTFTPDGTELGDYTDAFMTRIIDDAEISSKDRIQVCYSYRLFECLDEHPEYDESGEHMIDCEYTPKDSAVEAVNRLVSQLVTLKMEHLQYGAVDETLPLPPTGSWAEAQLTKLAKLGWIYEMGNPTEGDQFDWKKLMKAATRECLEVDRDYSTGDGYRPDYESDEKPWLVIDAIGDFQTMFQDSTRVIRWQYLLVEP